MMEPRSSGTEDLRDLRFAISERLEARTVVVERWTAIGSTSARIPLDADGFPVALLLVDAREVGNPGAPLTLTPNYSFFWDPATKTAQAYEPGGLVANTVYRLTYLVIGG